LGAPGPSTRRRATPREIEDAPSDNPFAPLSRESASRPSAPSTQTKLQDVRKVLREMPWMADYITDTGLAAVLRSGLDGAQDTPPSSLPGFRDERPVSPAVAPIDAQVHTTPVRATEQAARTIEPAAALRSEHDGAQDSPPTSLPVIRDERPASPAVAPIDAQVHTTSVRATEQAARTTEQPPTTLPAPTEPAAPVTPPAPRASSTSSLSSAPNNTKSPSPQPRRSKRRGAGRK
jgi:hypothetical protein